MLFKASGTCAPALHTVRSSPSSSSTRSSFRDFSSSRATLPLLHPAKRHNVRCRLATVCLCGNHTHVSLHVTYGVTSIKMQTMIRTTLRSHAPTIHSSGRCMNGRRLPVFSRAASRSQILRSFFPRAKRILLASNLIA